MRSLVLVTLALVVAAAPARAADPHKRVAIVVGANDPPPNVNAVASPTCSSTLWYPSDARSALA